MRKRLIAWAAVAALLLPGCLPQEAEEVPISVITPVVTQREIIEVRRGAIETRQTLNVSIGSAQQAALYFRTGGRVGKLHVAAGQRVQQGALLAELEVGNLPYDIESAEIDLQKARNTLTRALSRRGFVDAPSDADLQRYELDVRQAELRLQRLKDQLADTRLFAPFAGRIITLSIAVTDQVESFREVMILAAEGNLVARATVDEVTASLLQVGRRAEIFLNDGDPAPIPARVSSVPLVGSAARDRIVLVTPDEQSPRLQVGRNGRVEVILNAKQDALLVPVSAIRTHGGRRFVTVVNGASRQEVAIEVGLENAQYVEVLSGVNEGDRVVGR